MTFPDTISFDVKWAHFPETIGKDGRLCATCLYGKNMVEWVGIGQVRRTKDYSCELEPNQIRRTKNVIKCASYAPRPHTMMQRTLDSFGGMA